MRQYTPFVFAACAVGYVIPGWVLAQLSALHYAIAVVICLLSLGACIGLAWSRFTRSGRKTFAESTATDWAGTFAVAMLLVAVGTAGFAAMSTAIYGLGVGTFKGGELEGNQVSDAAYEFYLWHLADAIPLLKGPETMNWTLEHPFTDSIHGSLALVYTVLVAIPLVYTGTQIVVGATSDAANKEPGGRPR